MSEFFFEAQGPGGGSVKLWSTGFIEPSSEDSFRQDILADSKSILILGPPGVWAPEWAFWAARTLNISNIIWLLKYSESVLNQFWFINYRRDRRDRRRRRHHHHRHHHRQPYHHIITSSHPHILLVVVIIISSSIITFFMFIFIFIFMFILIW